LIAQIPRRLAGKPLREYLYRDFGSLVSLGEFSTVGLALHGAPKVALEMLARMIAAHRAAGEAALSAPAEGPLFGVQF
jgi:NADH dehydrogenase FAD-containing subunit